LLAAQQSEISGTITSKIREKLLELVWADKKQGAVSDTNGYYKVSLPSGLHQITIELRI
jgi:hypothetical protein